MKIGVYAGVSVGVGVCSSVGVEGGIGLGVCE